MDFLGFTFSVWAAIAVGVFFLCMVFACTADRRNIESSKWWVFIIGVAVLTYWQWGHVSLSYFLGAELWKAVGIYAGIGLAYSFVEFLFQVRREARYWADAWQQFKIRDAREQQSQAEAERNPGYSDVDQRSGRRPEPSRTPEPPETLEQRFIKHVNAYRERNRLVFIKLEEGAIVPNINKRELIESIGCWTLFWPAYAVSLVLGDLLTEIGRRFADVFVALSRGLIRRTFSKTFAR